ncbi:hypothetical protein OC846_006084 [Tilletia horrida]|uniref:START domain-containing protein n=1 Tax=Tilletia horrida TaxID=155126 RepID=A0AAN6JPM8_9BASI|nr:hypothetical protein OC846_006084 [Tilletia horrida]KAK0564599.1 hypothetical protein OC861_004189 [Tilletia horrida]
MEEQAEVTPASVLRRFLSIVEPSLVRCLPGNDEKPDIEEASQSSDLALDKWDLLYASQPALASFQPADLAQSTEHAIVVRTHPDPTKPLFSIQAYLPDLSARQFWTLMAESENRNLWDGSIQTVEITPLEEDSLPASNCGSNARLEVLSFGAIFMVTARRDMVLISVDAQLPPRPDESSSRKRDEQPPLRLMSASQSVVHPAFPPRKKYSRFDLGIGGFLVEDLTSLDRSRSGIMVTQISDLGTAATWLPASIIKMVASTMVPRSIVKIADRARQTVVPPELLSDKDLSLTSGKSSPDLGDGNARHMRPIGPHGEVWEVGRRLPALIMDPRRISMHDNQSSKTSPGVDSDGSDATAVTAAPINPSSEAVRVEEPVPTSFAQNAAAADAAALSRLRPSRLSVASVDTASRNRSSHRISIIDCKRPLSQLLVHDCSIQEDMSSAEKGSNEDEQEDEVSIRLADALSDELDRIILETVKTLRMNSHLKRSNANTASLRSSAFFTASSLPTDANFDTPSDSLQPRLPSEAAVSGHRRSRRAASRKILDASDVCSILLAPAAYEVPSSTSTDDSHQRQDRAAAETLKRQSLILDACHAEAEELVRAVGLLEQEKVVGTLGSEASRSYWTSWWPSFGLLRGMFPVVSWQSH